MTLLSTSVPSSVSSTLSSRGTVRTQTRDREHSESTLQHVNQDRLWIASTCRWKSNEFQYSNWESSSARYSIDKLNTDSVTVCIYRRNTANGFQFPRGRIHSTGQLCRPRTPSVQASLEEYRIPIQQRGKLSCSLLHRETQPQTVWDRREYSERIPVSTR